MSTRLARVTAAYATVAIPDVTGAPSVRGFYRDEIMPASADPEGVARLVRRGYAEWIDGPAVPEEPASAAEPNADEADRSKGGGDQPPPAARPATSAPKPEWIAYAVAQRAEGVSEDEAKAAAEGMSKNDLLTMFGG